MMLRVVFRRAAKAEFEEAVAWYGEKSVGLADEFMSEIDYAVAVRRLRRSDTPWSLAMFGALLRGTFHSRFTFVSVQTR